MTKKIIILAIAIVVGNVAVSAQKTKELTLLHSNDTHSCIYPLSVNLADTMLAGRGGFLRRIAMLKEERAKDPDLLYFDSGDFCQGSPFYNLYQGDVEIELMNRMGLDASTIGNHEFDFGLENMARIFRMANFPILCSNYDFTGTPVEGLTQRYIVIKRKGVKIGVFALDPMMEGLVSVQNFTGVKYLDPIATANEMTDLLRNKLKCDLVICISHMGWTTKGGTVIDSEIIAQTKGIDLVLGGHSHTYLDKLEYVTDPDGKQVAVDQNGKHGLYIGKMKLKLSKK